MKSKFQFRIRLLFSLVLIAASVLAINLYMVQILKGETYKDKAERQYVSPKESIFDRGKIYFSNKDGTILSAATIKSGFTLAINPKKIADPQDVYKKLSAVAPIDEAKFLMKASKTDDPYEELEKRISEEKAKEIDSLNISGVELQRDRWRLYPGGKMAASTLGFVGYDGKSFSGRYGLERYYEDTLKRDETEAYVNFFAEIFSNVNKAVSSDGRKEGDIITTIEPTVQSFFEKEAASTSEKWHSKLTLGVIMNPMNGEIYSFVVNPTFDPNTYGSESDLKIYSNPVAESIFEMGSTIKPLTMAAGLDAGAVTAETTYDDKGSLTLNGSTISNHDHKVNGVINMQTVLNKSVNTGAAYVVSKMGKENFAKYMIDFGLGSETGIDLPNEASGRISNLKSPRDIEYATASFGQGIAMTPIAAVRALSALANGGVLVIPHIVKKIDYKIGLSKNIFYGDVENKRVIKRETSNEITRMLVKVVDAALLDGTVKIPNYSVAAKTGTAQIAKPGGGGYYDDRYLHSFFGYFPAYNPRFFIFLMTLEPKGAEYASNTLTAPFIDTVKFLINYYEIPPDR
ncbi:MAG: peptidoglycan glycosyltransferase, cell division protein FtsI (penicillin-binding protein 3) [Parcubacteria group bacterium]|nr:peptidoglycan glycosyltransferase, cell division protein FtsI (penicillin-binding protein 3) [Parcubacteria group bacterium]